MPGTELAVGYVSLVPSGRGFGRSIIREAQSAGSSAGDSASSAFGSRFVSGMARIGRRAALALGAGIGAAGFFGVKVAADFEQTRIAFEGILGDVEKANRLLGDLRDFAAKTPFEFTGLADSAKQLLAVGFTSEEIIPTMTTLGNVAATLGVGEAEISGVVRALGQMRGKGKASAEELQQISEQIPGFSAIKVIAEDMGISTEKAFEKMSKGAIPADDAIESILNGMEKFPGAAGAMDRQSKTLNGVLSTLKDTVAGMAIDFITPYLPALSRGVQTFSGWLQNTVVPALESFAGWIGKLVDYWGPGLVSLFEDHLIPTVKGLVSDGLDAIKSWWDRNGETIKQAFISFANVAGLVLGAVGDWIWDTALPALDGFRDWFVNNKAAVIGVLAAIAAAFLAWAINAGIAAVATIIAAAPVYLLLAAVGLLAAGFYLLFTRSETFRNAIIRLALVAWVFGGQLINFFQMLWHWATMAYNVMKDVRDAIKSIIDLAPDLPGGVSPGSFLPGPFGNILGFDDGGVIGGPRGAPRLVLAHAGETILPTHKASIGAFTGGGDTTVNVYGVPYEDAGQATLRGLRKIRLMAAA